MDARFDFSNFDKDKVCIIPHRKFFDDRGCFAETFRANEFYEATGLEFKQMNYSVSERGAWRGLHYQKPPKETAKLIKCLSGAILDVSLNMKTGEVYKVLSDASTHNSKYNNLIYVPGACAHGILALEENTIIAYLTTEYHVNDLGVGLSYKGILDREPAIVSRKDAEAPTWEEYNASR